MEKNELKFLGLSVALHLLAIIFILVSSAGKLKNSSSESKTVNQQNITVHILNKPKNKKNSSKKYKTSKIALIEKKKDSDGVTPKHWFGGVGILTVNTNEGIYVMKVYSGYPADKAGLEAGDIIVNVSGGHIRGTPGTIVILQVLRNGENLTFTIIRNKIYF